MSAAIVASLNKDPKLARDAIADLAAKISQTGKDKEKEVEDNLKIFTALANEAILVSEPYLCLHLGAILAAAGSKVKAIREAAEAAVAAITYKMNPNSIKNSLPALFAAAAVGGNYQSRALALRTINSFSDSAPFQLGVSLPEIVPEVTTSMADPKKEVKEAATQCMTSSCDVIGNRDIEHMTSKIVRSITNPEETPEIMHSLAGVTFVQSVTAPCLAMVVPLLIRGLRAKVTATRRQSCVIIDNMS
jgi:elongation factor 3